jgi:RNA polymerase sigma factor (sigma-70 family)
MDERLLMGSFLDGDEEAFEQLYLGLWPVVVGVIRRRCRLQLADAEDLTSIVFLALYAHRDDCSYDPSRPFRPWFWRFAFCRVYDELRRRTRTRPPEVPLDNGIAEATLATRSHGDRLHEEWRWDELLAEVREALEALSDQERTFIEEWEKALGDLPQNAIAQQLGVCNSRVSTIKTRALDTLAGCLGRTWTRRPRRRRRNPRQDAGAQP